MTPDFFNLSYLEKGSALQQKGLEAIRNTYVMDVLKDFDPVLAGTLPLDLFVKNSDLDILGYSQDLSIVEKRLIEKYGSYSQFKSAITNINDSPSLIVNFTGNNFPFEIFVQSIPTRKQLAYRHMLIEYSLIKKYGEEFKNKVIQLKKQGIKTEPAFAQLLGLSGDPYAALLQLE